MYKQVDRNEMLREEVQEVIERHGIKAKYICEMIGMSAPILSKWRNNKSYFSTRNLNKIDHFLGKYRGEK